MTSTYQKIRVAVIGSGWVTEHRHLPVVTRAKRVSVQVIISKDSTKAHRLQSKFSIPECYCGEEIDWQQALKGCEAVIIGVDPFAHFSIAKTALLQGKHVLLEKPLTLSVLESEELLVLAREQKLRFAVVHNFQYSSGALQLDDDIRHGKLGALQSLEAIQYSNEKRRLPVWYERLPWGLFYDESPHLLYLLERYGGTQTLVQSSVLCENNRTTPHLVESFFRGKNALPSVLRMNFRASLSEWFFIVHGTNRTGVLDIFRDLYFSLPNDGRHYPWQVVRTSIIAFVQHTKGTLRSIVKVLAGRYWCGNDQVVRIFIEAILDERPLGSIDAEAGLRVNRMQHEIMSRSTRL